MKNKIKSIARKNVYLIWSALFLWLCFQLSFQGLIYMSKLYVSYTEQLYGSVSQGVMVFLLENFEFFMATLVGACVIYFLCIWPVRWLLLKLSKKMDDTGNIHAFSNLVNFVLNFFISIGFVFLFGVKDNYFELFYTVLDTVTSVEDSTITSVSYNIFLNWYFCAILIIKMIVEALFSKDALDEKLGVKKEDDSKDEKEEPTAEEEKTEA